MDWKTCIGQMLDFKIRLMTFLYGDESLAS